jgi:hypothetical protein
MALQSGPEAQGIGSSPNEPKSHAIGPLTRGPKGAIAGWAHLDALLKRLAAA